MMDSTRVFFVTVDQDVLGPSLEATSPEEAVSRACADGLVPPSTEITVRWDVKPGTEPGTWRSARITSLRSPAASIVASAVVEPAAPSVKPAAPAPPEMAPPSEAKPSRVAIA